MAAPNSTVLVFSGRKGTGKSTVTRILSERLNWLRVSFGDYVREEVVRRQLDPSDISVLQTVGQDLVDTDAPGFVRAVLASGFWTPSYNVIVDGLRHLEIKDEIARIIRPANLFHIHLATDESIRESRLRDRISSTPLHNIDFASLESHATELEVRRVLSDFSDTTISTDASPEEAVEAIMHWLRQRASGSEHL